MPRPHLLRRAFLAAIVGVALGAGGVAALADAPKAGFAPDPPAHASKKQWVFEMTAAAGKVSIDRARSVTLEKPIESARVFGRFALELYVGRELLDRVRFNVPLMGAETPVGRRGLPRPSFEKNVTTRLKVQIADNPRAAYLLLVDRETGDSQRFDWPPASDGKLLPWKTGQLSEAGPGDFPEGGARVAAVGDGGQAADAAPPAARAPSDAGRD